ncbi:hypothetical protein SRHO_G00314750 [Serrasalmus rhombeus]
MILAPVCYFAPSVHTADNGDVLEAHFGRQQDSRRLAFISAACLDISLHTGGVVRVNGLRLGSPDLAMPVGDTSAHWRPVATLQVRHALSGPEWRRDGENEENKFTVKQVQTLELILRGEW